MLTQINTQTPIRFKANDYQLNYNNRYTPPMPEENTMDDVFMMQAMEQQKAEKKEKSKENWNKAGVLAQIGIATAFLGMLAMSIIGAVSKKGIGSNQVNQELEALTKVNLKWQDFKGKKLVADLDSKTTSKSLKETFTKIINQRKLSQNAKEWGGVPDGVDMIYLYGHGGVGKTYVAEQFAQEINALFTNIKYPDIGSPYKDAGSMRINRFFENIIEMANKNKDRDVVACIDEFDAVIKKINDGAQGSGEAAKARAAVLTGIDKVRKQCKNVTFIATSNYHPESGLVDSIALRRFNNKVLVPLPNEIQSEALTEMYLKKQNIGALKDEKFFKSAEFKDFTKKLCKNGYSNGEIALIAEEAGKAFRTSLVGVADSEIHKHPFSVKYLEEGLKINGEAASKTNDLMNVSTGSSIRTPRQNTHRNNSNQGFLKRIWNSVTNMFK